MSNQKRHGEEATVNHANEAVEIAVRAADYQPVDAAIAYGIRIIEYEHNVEFNKYLIQYINNQVR